MVTEPREFFVVNCWSAQINKTIKVKGIENDDKTVSFPVNSSWTELTQLRAFKFTNWNVVTKLKFVATNFHFETEEIAKAFVKAFYQNAIFNLKKCIGKKEYKIHQKGIKNSIMELKKLIDKEVVFEEWNMSYFEYKEMIDKAKAKNVQPPKPIEVKE